MHACNHRRRLCQAVNDTKTSMTDSKQGREGPFLVPASCSLMRAPTRHGFVFVGGNASRTSLGGTTFARQSICLPMVTKQDDTRKHSLLGKRENKFAKMQRPRTRKKANSFVGVWLVQEQRRFCFFFVARRVTTTLIANILSFGEPTARWRHESGVYRFCARLCGERETHMR